MTRVEHGEAALALLRLLLEAQPDPTTLDRIGWRVLVPVALRNGVLLRVITRAAAAGLRVPDAVSARERARAVCAFAVVRRVSEICEQHGILYVFPKALLHHPDVGRDLDLLVGSASVDTGRLIARELGAAPSPRNLGSRIAGSATFEVAGAPPLDIQHGRLGAAGEQVDFASAVLANRCSVDVDGAQVAVASGNDQLVLQGLQRVFGKRYIRIADLLCTITILRRNALDWPYVLATATRTGAVYGLGCYLGYVEQLHREALGRPLLQDRLAQRLAAAGSGTAEFRDDVLRYPTLRIAARVFPRTVQAQVLAGNWSGVGRLCLMPLVGATSVLKQGRASIGGRTRRSEQR